MSALDLDLVRPDGSVLVWTPQEGPQEAFVTCPIRDVFYGGARGGGKTDGLLGDFLAQAGKYGANARGILFRRTLVELSQVIQRSKEIYFPLGWKYQEQKHDWTAPNGAVLRLRYLESDSDAESYQGHDYTWLGFDELGNFPNPAPIDKLWGILRSAAGVPCVRRSTGNPGGPGHAWVKKRYIDAGPYNVTSWAPNPDRPDLFIESVFIPSLLDDNRILLQNDPNYETGLAAAGTPALYRAWRYGDWSILAGQYFDTFSRGEHVVRRPQYEIEPWHVKWLSMDWGYSDRSVAYWHRIDEDRKIVTYRELAVNKTTPDVLGRMIADKNGDTKLANFWLSPDAFHQRHSERTIADELWDGAARAIPRPSRADDDRVGGWSLMYQLLQSGHWKIDEGCTALIESLPLLVRDVEKNPEDCMESSGYDDPPDAARYGIKSYHKSGNEPISGKRLATAAAIVDITARNMAIMAAQAATKSGGVGVRPRRYH